MRKLYEPRPAALSWPRRWTLMDSVILAPGKEVMDNFFVDCKKFKDGSPKGEADTNMTMSGMLGYPFVLDAHRMDLHFEHFDRPEDVREVLRKTVLFLDPGQGREVRVAASTLEPLVLFPNSRSPHTYDPDPEKPGSEDRMDVGDAMALNVRSLWNGLLDELRKLQEIGVWRHYGQLVCLFREDRKEVPRKYGPTASIACQIAAPELSLSGPVRLQCALSGILRHVGLGD